MKILIATNRGKIGVITKPDRGGYDVFAVGGANVAQLYVDGI